MVLTHCQTIKGFFTFILTMLD